MEQNSKIKNIVTYKVAKAIKEAGFDLVCEYAYTPHDGHMRLFTTEDNFDQRLINNSGLIEYYEEIGLEEYESEDDCTAPDYLAVWNWLKDSTTIKPIEDELKENTIEDIKNKIEYLVKNGMIKSL